MKRLSKVALILVGVGALALAANFVFVHRGLVQAKASDSRNDGITVYAHYEYFTIPNSIVFDLRRVEGENSMADVTRLLLQFAQTQKDHRYRQVTLAYRGESKFKLEGEYFQTLGEEFGEQNPVYTIRTLPENLYMPDGERAFGTWTGGLLGVLGKQMEDHQEFHRRWYLQAMADGER